MDQNCPENLILQDSFFIFTPQIAEVCRAKEPVIYVNVHSVFFLLKSPEEESTLQVEMRRNISARLST